MTTYILADWKSGYVNVFNTDLKAPLPPVADYTPCPECGHPLAYQDQFRGCQTIVELRCKEREPNVMCGCISSLEVMDGQ